LQYSINHLSSNKLIFFHNVRDHIYNMHTFLFYNNFFLTNSQQRLYMDLRSGLQNQRNGRKNREVLVHSEPPDHESVYWACEYILRSLSSSPAGKQNRVKRLFFFFFMFNVAQQLYKTFDVCTVSTRQLF